MTLSRRKQQKKKPSLMTMKVKITDANLSAARKRAANIGPNSKKIMPGSEIYGMLGEQLFLDNYGGELIDCYDYDINHPKIGKIDIKTKKCSSEPQDDYYCSVSAYQIGKQNCDYYAFYRVQANLSVGWFLGIISKKEFIEKATLFKKGDKDGNFEVKADCYNIKISDLRNISEVLKNVDCKSGDNRK